MLIVNLMFLFQLNTQKFDLPQDLLSSLCFVESKYDINAIHKDDGKSDSLGVCQIKLATAKQFGFKGTKTQLMNPYTNIHYAAKYLKYQIDRYHGYTTKAIISYNKGSAKNLTHTKYSDKVINEWRRQADERIKK